MAAAATALFGAPALADSPMPRDLVDEMAKHGLTEADQLRLFGEGVTNVDGFKSLNDASLLASGVDIAARRRAKQQLESREPRLHQVQELLDGAGLSASARDAVRGVADLHALHLLDEHAMAQLGIGIMDRTKLLERRSAWRRMAMRKVPTEPEAEAASRAARDRPRRIGFAALMLLGVAVSMVGWWSLYGDLGLWGGVVGGVLVLVGGLGWLANCGLGFGSYGGCRILVWTFIFIYPIGGTAATILSATYCPSMTDVRHPNCEHCEHTYDWGSRFEYDRCAIWGTGPHPGAARPCGPCGPVVTSFGFSLAAAIVFALYQGARQEQQEARTDAANRARRRGAPAMPAMRAPDAASLP